MTSIPSESDPVILVWDLRNSHAPERVSLSQSTDHKTGNSLILHCRSSKATKTESYRSRGVLKIPNSFCHRARITEQFAGTLRRVRNTESCRSSRTGLSKHDGIRITPISLLLLPSMARSPSRHFRTRVRRLLRPQRPRTNRWTGKISLRVHRTNLRLPRSHCQKLPSGWSDPFLHLSVSVEGSSRWV